MSYRQHTVVFDGSRSPQFPRAPGRGHLLRGCTWSRRIAGPYARVAATELADHAAHAGHIWRRGIHRLQNRYVG